MFVNKYVNGTKVMSSLMPELEKKTLLKAFITFSLLLNAHSLFPGGSIAPHKCQFYVMKKQLFQSFITLFSKLSETTQQSRKQKQNSSNLSSRC